jgi:hypothetical protein
VISAIENSKINSKKPRFWKEKSVEDVVVTLGAKGTGGHTS